MATPFDSLAKEVLDLLLHEVGTLETEAEVPALPSQRADVCSPRIQLAPLSVGRSASSDA